MPRLSGKVVLVTGASRGIGRGIALALAKEGARVYITGRHGSGRTDHLVGGLDATAAEVSRAAAEGGTCTPLVCDHDDDAAVEAAIGEIFQKEGRLDVLVNNAFSGCDVSGNLAAKCFWEKSLDHWDKFHRVGLRSHYIATALCARRWVANGQQALVVNVSSAAGFGYTFDVAYGVGKAAVDRLSADTGKELKPHGIAVICVWPGAVATEVVKKSIADEHVATKGGQFDEMESVEFCGRGVAALAADPKVMRFSGRVVMTPELAEEYGFKDLDGRIPWGTFLKRLRYGMGYPPRMWTLGPPPKAAAKGVVDARAAVAIAGACALSLYCLSRASRRA